MPHKDTDGPDSFVYRGTQDVYRLHTKKKQKCLKCKIILKIKNVYRIIYIYIYMSSYIYMNFVQCVFSINDHYKRVYKIKKFKNKERYLKEN